MKNHRKEMTDELLAQYLEGTLDEKDRLFVESCLAEDEELMDLAFMAKGEMTYQEEIANTSVFALSMNEHNEYALAAASEKMDCAIKAQQMVLSNYGIEVSVDELTKLAQKQGWFEESKGSAFDFVGELLNHYGVASVQMRNAGIYHIMHELSQGHKIIVGVDDAQETSGDTPADHVLLVAGIDTTDPNELKVNVKDPNDPEHVEQYTAKQFMDRWAHTGCFMVSTKTAAPLTANPEMQNFDYELGYVRKFADVAYEEIIKRLAADGIITIRDQERKRKLRFYLIGIAVLAIIAAAGYYLWRVSTPLHVKVNVVEDHAHSIPALPFNQGTMRCEYADNAIQTIQVKADNPTVFLNEIPFRQRKTKIHLSFTADGYCPVDTLVDPQPSITIPLRRNNALGVVFGMVIDFQTEQPVEGAKVTLQNLTTMTDAFGAFRIDIPLAKQNKTQRVVVTKEGFQPWEGFYRPSETESWYIVLKK